MKNRGSCLTRKRLSGVLLTIILCISSAVQAEDTAYDSALWIGALALWEHENSLDYSVEYQLRLNDHMSSYGNDFVEFMGYNKFNENVLFNGGYRFTRREDHNESRLYFGGFLDLTRTSRGIDIRPGQFRVTLQIGYQHDFNAEFDNRLMGSNSVRWIVVASKPASKRLTPFLLAGVLTTWNDAYSFGVDKIRLGGGLAIHATPRSRVRIQYIWENSQYVTPEKRTNILWLRYEMILGQRTSGSE
jgi:hypothetical protein